MGRKAAVREESCAQLTDCQLLQLVIRSCSSGVWCRPPGAAVQQAEGQPIPRGGGQLGAPPSLLSVGCAGAG